MYTWEGIGEKMLSTVYYSHDYIIYIIYVYIDLYIRACVIYLRYSNYS